MIGLVFIAQQGELSLKAAFLLHTLKKYIAGSYHFYVAVPEEDDLFSDQNEWLIQFYRSEGANIITFNNTFLKGKKIRIPGDVVSNKIFALKYNFKEEQVLFLDSDIAAIRPLQIETLSRISDKVSCKPANRNHNIDWEKLYSLFDLDFPKEKVVTSVDRMLIPPYFNSGVMLINSEIRNTLVSKWEKYFDLLSSKELISGKLFPVFHRDQVALSLALQSLGYKVDQLDEHYNFPLRARKIDKSDLPVLIHYHHPVSVYFNQWLYREFMEFTGLRPEFYKETGKYHGWRQLFHSGIFTRTVYAGKAWLSYKKYVINKFLRS